VDPIFDLFGDPVPKNWNGRGRPGHVRTQENRNKVSMLLAFGWNDDRIARALRISVPTLKRYYFLELNFRDEQRDRLDAALASNLWKQVEAGSVSAMKEFQKLLERNDLMLYGQAASKPQPGDKSAEQKLGKKEAADFAARNPDASTPLGELMMRRQQLN
jgi:hypothetical protein